MIDDVVFEKLVQVAKDRGLITYRELGQHADMDTSYLPDMDKLILALEHIADQETKTGRPLLVALVVRKDTMMPGGGLHKYAKKHHRQCCWCGYACRWIYWRRTWTTAFRRQMKLDAVSCNISHQGREIGCAQIEFKLERHRCCRQWREHAHLRWSRQPAAWPRLPRHYLRHT